MTTSRDRPILFRPALVRAILHGKKTETRRVVQPQPRLLNAETDPDPAWEWPTRDGKGNRAGCASVRHLARDIASHSPYGRAGDRLWVRETWHRGDVPGAFCYLADKDPQDEEKGCTNPGRWKPSIHMPRAACRLVLEVLDVRVERLGDITSEGAWAEGTWREFWDECARKQWAFDPMSNGEPVRLFREAWDRLNAPRGFGWDANPWVWVVKFRRVPDAAT